MLEYLFGSPVVEKILFYLLVNQKCYASQLKASFKTPLFSFQRALAKLEKGGLVVAHREGKTLIYQFNPLYPFLDDFKAFLMKAYQFIPEDIKQKYYEPSIRKRPRRQSKPL